jgi:hypothetical protein
MSPPQVTSICCIPYGRSECILPPFRVGNKLPQSPSLFAIGPDYPRATRLDAPGADVPAECPVTKPIV